MLQRLHDVIHVHAGAELLRQFRPLLASGRREKPSMDVLLLVGAFSRQSFYAVLDVLARNTDVDKVFHLWELLVQAGNEVTNLTIRHGNGTLIFPKPDALTRSFNPVRESRHDGVRCVFREVAKRLQCGQR